jgi:hypothetical protein
MQIRKKGSNGTFSGLLGSYFKHNGENITQNFARWKYYRLCAFGCGVSLGLERWYPGLELQPPLLCDPTGDGAAGSSQTCGSSTIYSELCSVLRADIY